MFVRWARLIERERELILFSRFVFLVGVFVVMIITGVS